MREQGTRPSPAGPRANHILQSLPSEEYKRLVAHFEPMSLRQNDVLSEVAAPITYGYFLNDGLVATMVVMRDEHSVEVGLLGNEGFAGLPILLNIAHSSSRLIVQISGDATRIKAEVLRQLLPELPILERLLSRFAYLQALQLEQIAACNRLHEVDQRLARWLLMAKDRVHMQDLPLIHDQLARMLGTRRSSVTVAMGALEKAGVIGSQRGGVHILNRDKLEKVACECYGIVHDQLEAYLKSCVAIRPDV